MKRVCLLILFSVAGLSVVAGEEAEGTSAEVTPVEETPAEVTPVEETPAEVTPAEIQAMEKKILTVNDPAARLFYQANIYRAKGEMEKALQSLAKLTALHSHNERWVTRSELLSAMLYLEVGLPDAAEVTSRQVEFLNKGTDAAEQARRFLETIGQVEKQSEEVK
ncbi:MAG: hypothetical protein H8E68_03945 [Kiritimatiellaeota bacterium]|nr:hypothetical protein [Kiritimatiellota bacterium]